MELKEKLIELRREKGWTQEELAQEVGVTRQAVSKWERGVIAPATVNLVALSRVYGVPLDELVNGEQQCREPPATTVAVVEKPEAGEKRGKPSLLKTVGAVALAGCLLLTGAVAGIVIGFTLLNEPKEPKHEIIWMENLENEEIDLESLIHDPDAIEVIVP